MSTSNYFSVFGHINFPTLPSNSCHVTTENTDIFPNLQPTGSRDSKEGIIFLSNLFLHPLTQTVTKSHFFFFCNTLYFQTFLYTHALKALPKTSSYTAKKVCHSYTSIKANNIPNAKIIFLFF